MGYWFSGHPFLNSLVSFLSHPCHQNLPGQHRPYQPSRILLHGWGLPPFSFTWTGRQRIEGEGEEAGPPSSLSPQPDQLFTSPRSPKPWPPSTTFQLTLNPCLLASFPEEGMAAPSLGETQTPQNTLHSFTSFTSLCTSHPDGCD